MNTVVENIGNKLIAAGYEGYWYEKDIIYFRYYEDFTCELEDIKENVNFQFEQGVCADHKRLIHAEKFVSITKPAREYAQNNGPDVKAEAYVIPSLSQKILFNLFTRLRKHSHPIRCFDQLDEALAWLNKW
jgi:hypothetical protein